MRKTVRRNIFAGWFLDEEEQWLNEMSEQGWHLQQVRFFRYIFEQGAPGQYIIRAEMPGGEEAPKEYIEFMESTGAEYLSSTGGSIFYFRKLAALGEFELYSDVDSRLKHMNRWLLGACGSLLLPLFYFLTWPLKYIRNGEFEPGFMFLFGMLSFGCMALVGCFILCLLLAKRRQLKQERALRE